MKKKSLQTSLEELERTDSGVRKAAEKYAETVDAMIDHNTVTIETTSEPDGLGRQHFSVVWWDGDFHMGPRWRGQHFHDRVTPYAERAKEEGKRVIVRAKVKA